MNTIPPVNKVPYFVQHTLLKIITLVLFIVPFAMSFFVWFAHSDTHESKDYIEDLEHFAAFNAFTVCHFMDIHNSYFYL